MGPYLICISHIVPSALLRLPTLLPSSSTLGHQPHRASPLGARLLHSDASMPRGRLPEHEQRVAHGELRDGHRAP